MRIQGKLYDGKSSKPLEVLCTLASTGLSFEVQGDDPVMYRYYYNELKISPRLGNTKRYIDTDDGKRFEFEHRDGVDDYFKKNFLGAVHLLEANMKTVVLSVVVFFGLIAWAYLHGLPLLSRALAPVVPVQGLELLGEQSELLIDKHPAFSESKLTEEKQEALIEGFQKLNHPDTKVPITYRFVDFKGGPNAFALPHGRILITDKLVEIAPSVDHIHSVILHEIGHVYHHHNMRGLIERSALAVIVFSVTGAADVSSLPVLLMNSSYSREHETEADEYAAKELLKMGKSPMLLAEILKEMEDYHKKKIKKSDGPRSDSDHLKDQDQKQQDEVVADLFEFLSTHPLTKNREEYLRKMSDGAKD